ncbi:cytochrome P450 [Peniophora sp. CONT]|nr:cytochrome P450 [Peniophora sp. CONT]
MIATIDLVVICAALGWWAYLLARTRTRLPPSPKLWPVIGAVREMMSKQLWLIAQRWGKEIGDVVYLSIMGQGIVFLNSRKAAFELLDRRGSIYSDRPHLVMSGELCGCSDMVAFTGYGEQSKRQRRLFANAFGPQHIPAYRPLILDATMDVLRRLVDTPEQYQEHFRRYTGGLTLQVVYGYKPTTSGPDAMIDFSEECIDLLANRIASSASVWLVDIFPRLKDLPEWLPGMRFKRLAREWKAKMVAWVDAPYVWMKAAVASGNAPMSFCSSLLEEKRGSITEQFEHDLSWTANSMYAASLDTTVGMMSHFVLAMVQHPEVLQRAQEEIDRVIGTDRLPVFGDRTSLPYVEAIVSETLRFACPVPLGLPHRLTEDDVYEGRHIPKGTFVFANLWAILRDPALYPEPDTYKPDRFLDLSVEQRSIADPRNYVFGFGRRICPGMHLVDASAWLLIACMLATLDIRKARDDAGKEVEPVVEYSNSVFRTPSSFACSIAPRSTRALALLREI